MKTHVAFSFDVAKKQTLRLRKAKECGNNETWRRLVRGDEERVRLSSGPNLFVIC